MNNPTVLQNGAEVLHYTERHPGGNGLRPHGIALCRYQHGIGEYVTWVIADHGENGWIAESGRYHENLLDAVADYNVRADVEVTL